MKSGMTRWNGEPLKPKPCSPVASSRKLRAVFGTTSSYSLNSMRPSGSPFADTSKKTFSLIALLPCGSKVRIEHRRQFVDHRFDDVRHPVQPPPPSTLGVPYGSDPARGEGGRRVGVGGA